MCVNIPDAALLLDNLVSYNTTIYIYYIYTLYIEYIYQLALRYLYCVIGIGLYMAYMTETTTTTTILYKLNKQSI